MRGAGQALIPLALGSDKPGSEIEAPMAVVILFGLLSSTLLNMIVVPVVYLRFGYRKRKLGQRSLLVSMPMLDLREMGMHVRRPFMFVLMDMAYALMRFRMAVGMVASVMLVPVFVRN